MTPDHDTVRESLDAWALGALDADEARAVEAHLAGCDECAPDADAARESAASLALAVPLVAAPVELKARIMASANVLREMPRPRSRVSRWWPGAAAAALIVALGSLGWAASMQRQVNDTNSRNSALSAAANEQANALGTMRADVSLASAQNAALTGQQDAVVDVMSQPDVRRAQLVSTSVMQGVSGRYVWSPSSDVGIFLGTGLPALPEGKSYCMWMVYEGGWVVGGLFGPDGAGVGRLVVHDTDNDAGLGQFKGFVVTVEPSNMPSSGAQAHSGAPVLQSITN